MWLMDTRTRLAILVFIVASALGPWGKSQRPAVAQGMKVFTATDGTFQFSYPGQFRVCIEGKLESCACETEPLVCAAYPAKEFEGTNFGSAWFQVKEISSRGETMTADGCATPYPPKYSGGVSEYPEFQISAQHPTERIGGV